jgi:phage baseplate assembly protein V
LPAGSEAATLSLNGDPGNTVVVATGHRASRPRNLKPGQSTLYDQSGSSILLTNDHNAKIAATGTIEVDGDIIKIAGSHDIKLAGTVDIAGPVNITGAVHITGSLVLNGVTMVAP